MKDKKELTTLILRGVALAMGVAVTVLSILEAIEPKACFTMLGLGLACLAVSLLPQK